MAHVLVVTWRAKPGEEGRVEEILRTMQGLSRAEPGTLTYTAHRSLEDPRDFLLYEAYRDEAAFEAHQATDYFKRYVLGEALPRLESRVRRFFALL